ncbi:AEC family transporter [Pseudorhodobacter sp.]|uniref:AEC family transporter n=1 Tax=Pseudorhodobacter sp. TaxID=1934400 RepID=UPI00264860C8|nr:AEC family transporter [Pseudorhodobacter sp.]MDN5788364.1 AEC family transporter [Pseudorhodobacter sp.]
MNALLDVILPVFLILGAGYVAAWRKIVDEGAIDGVMRFAQNFAVPCLLFRSISRLDLAQSFDPGLLISFYAGALGAGVLGYLGARVFFARDAKDALSIAFVASFSNTLLLGLPITERAYGADALAGNYAIISIHSPLIYAIGISLMEAVRSRGQGMAKAALLRQILRAILSQPLVLGILGGFVVNLTGLPLPTAVSSAVDMMVRAAIPAALFGLGGVLVRYRPEGDMKTIAMVCGLSLIAHPLITYGLGRFVFGLNTDQMRSAVVTAAMAPGVNAYLYANIYSAARRVAASSVLLATAATIVTAWAWLHLLP